MSDSHSQVESWLSSRSPYGERQSVRRTRRARSVARRAPALTTCGNMAHIRCGNVARFIKSKVWEYGTHQTAKGVRIRHTLDIQRCRNMAHIRQSNVYARSGARDLIQG